MRYFAIGDVHGMNDLLGQLMAQIEPELQADVHSRLVFLGDYTDRGPDSRGVIQRIIDLQAAYPNRVIALRGNHEQMFIDYFRGGVSEQRHFLDNGGDFTLASYGDRYSVPQEHRDWLDALPLIHVDDSDGILFLHAGFNPYRFPEITEQEALWARYPSFFNSHEWPDHIEHHVVHGHTPVFGSYYHDDRRTNLDTGAVFGGQLTGAEFVLGRLTRTFEVKSDYDYTEQVHGKKMVNKNGVYRLVDNS